MKLAFMRFKIQFQFWDGKFSAPPIDFREFMNVDNQEKFMIEFKKMSKYCTDGELFSMSHIVLLSPSTHPFKKRLAKACLQSLKHEATMQISCCKLKSALYYLAAAQELNPELSESPACKLGTRLHLLASAAVMTAELERCLKAIEPGPMRCPVNHAGNTPLHSAVASENQKNVVVLCKYLSQDQIGMTNIHGQTALHEAVHQQRTKVIEFLCRVMTIDQIELEDIEGNCAFKLAYRQWTQGQNSRSLAGFVTYHDPLKHNPNYQGPNMSKMQHCKNRNAMHYLAADTAQKLEIWMKDSSQSDRCPLDGDGNTPLHVAAKNGNSANVKVLCKYLTQEQISLANKEGQTALHVAVNGSKAKIIEILCQILPNEQIGCKDNEGNTALHLAALRNQGALELLCEYMSGKQLSLTNKFGKTALHYAVTPFSPPKNAGILCHRLSRDQLRLRDIYGKTALDIAVKFKAPSATLEILRNSMDSIQSCQSGASKPLKSGLI